MDKHPQPGAEDKTISADENTQSIELDTPIKRGTSVVNSLTLRKPAAGELRGVSLVELMQMDVQSLSKVLPRISTPTLTEHEVLGMDPADLVQCGVTVSGFLLQKSAKVAFPAT
jgi:Phage tail assembly chaperone proteins, E, or 41 or 14